MIWLELQPPELMIMTPVQLHSLWRDTCQSPVPHIRPDLLRRSIANRSQKRLHDK